ncbi:hypothetical protein [Bradyrhizobium canariense]|uniref:Uncharacterized protein n=1 Tax=Bradyrhizobium canariense TaxID=255045 RepID=A0A1X3GXP2_9BRAD|nr:hypothetical protein [Bradyrhizobium canariense]OSI65452.1 hypothetical protein BSZ22_31655 [Bradyrhizobium canariense]OSI75766.1 hypothetical protein BSZ23_26985 [Bradyrhizobium canariense]OSI85522.1 hypothetical protein BSZ24_31115 [Bradyrhizobium canariense]OSI87111.1 hypothetical protein BSZ25_28585 [Bradyrhizobium canariense]OSI99550.1 hypothetical protein BSZ16_29630 [Bradyrhizobium canariense]
MMTTHDTIFDKNGKRVLRSNMIIEDGDRLVVAMRMMDTAQPLSVSLCDTRQDGPPTRDELEDMREARIAALCDRWRDPAPDTQIKPSAQSDKTKEQLLDERDRRLENAWRN